MRLKGPEKSSILLLGRNTVIVGAIVIIAVSFVFGYFFGYKGSGVADTETKPPEEKKIAEAPDSPVLPPAIKPQEFPKETPEQKTEAVDAVPGPDIPRTDAKDSPDAGKMAEEKTMAADKPKEGDEGTKTGKTVGKAKKKTGTNGISRVAKTSGKSHGNSAKNSAKGTYAVQVGAFPHKDGAEQLLKSLRDRKINAYIVNAGKDDPYFRVRIGTFKDKQGAERAAAALQKKTGLQNFVTK